MSFDSDYYTSQHPEIGQNGLDPEVHYLTTGWETGEAANSTNTPVTPDEILQMIAGTGDDLTEVVAGLNDTQLAFIDEATDFDLGAVLGSLDDSMLGGFMAGWGADELSYLNGLTGFDLGERLDEFDPNTLMGMMNNWEGTANLEYLANVEGFEFDALVGSDPEAMMALIGRMGDDYQTMIYQDFGADDFAWLDGAADFDLAGMMTSNFGFFEGVMAPDEALGLFGYLGDNLTDVVAGFNATNLAFLDGAENFDLGAVLGSLDDSMLGGFMQGWGADELSYLNGLTGFDLGAQLEGFDPELMGTMLAEWKDPEAIGLLAGLEGFDFGAKLDEIPDTMVGDMMGGWDSGMLDQLGGVGGDFDVNNWLTDADSYLPPDFAWTPPEGDITMPPEGGDITMPPEGGDGGSMLTVALVGMPSETITII